MIASMSVFKTNVASSRSNLWAGIKDSISVYVWLDLENFLLKFLISAGVEGRTAVPIKIPTIQTEAMLTHVFYPMDLILWFRFSGVPE